MYFYEKGVGIEVMNRSEFARFVASEYEVSIEASDGWVKAVFDCLAKAIVENDCVRINNFGAFNHVVRKPRVGRHPITGERMDIPSRVAVEFIPCGRMDDAVKKIPVDSES